MRVNRVLLVLFVGASLSSSLQAITVQVNGSAPSTVPEIVRNTGNTAPFSIALQLLNESESNPETLTLWQFDVSVVGDNAATGSVELVSVTSPANPFFDGLGPAVVPPITLPSAQALIQDADIPSPMMFPGKIIPATEIRDVVDIELAASANAQGTFYLVLGDFDPINGSVWFDGLLAPQAFANAAGTTLPGKNVLARITYAVPEPSNVILFASAMVVLEVIFDRKKRRLVDRRDTDMKE